jgi:acyl-CoA synthetase (AMP-forming)/AMP-acid ligase II
VVTFNLADLFEMVCDAVPDREAVVAGERRFTYRTLDERANRLAHHLTSAGIKQGEHVGLQLLNGTEYIEGMLACFKIRAVPINVNYRYVEDELRYLFDDADLRAVIVHRQFAERVAKIQPSLDLLTHVLIVEDGTDAPVPDASRKYESALSSESGARDFGPRSPDDIYCAYTGGTTGMPKGVLWRQEDIFFAGIGGGDPLHAGNVVERPEGLLERIYDVGLCALPTPPFMHVSAHWLVFSMLLGAGKIVITPGGRFEPATIWQLVGDERVNVLVIVGDAMARPLADELEAHRDGYDTSALMVIGSGGAVLSPDTKNRLTAVLPNVFVVDGFGSSETGTMGAQPSSAAAGPAKALRFAQGDDIAVFDEELQPVVPGSGVVGRLARRGHIPLGYYKDPQKTAETFVEVDGVRWVTPGDFATVDDDGTIVLRGRGSISINTGGEKVYPEEVEGAIKEHPDVFDAVVVGVPDERWGERVVAVVQPRDARAPTLDDLKAFLRARLAGYKVPRELVLVEKVERQPSAKPDYRWARERAMEARAGVPEKRDKA